SRDLESYNRKKLWETDSMKIKSGLIPSMLRLPGYTPEEMADEYRNPPRNDLFWFSDTVLFNYINSVKYNYDDPSYKEILSAYSEYQKADTQEYLNTILNNDSLPVEIIKQAQF